MKKIDIRYYSHGNLAISSLKNVVDSIVPVEIPNYIQIFSCWKNIVNKSASEISFPYKILTIKNKNGLLIKSKRGYSIELQHSSPQILKALNNYLNENFFSFIKIRQIDDEEFQKERKS